MLEKKGLVKLVEECGELTQVAAKKIACMNTDLHWDNNGSLKERLENEIADVLAAIAVVSDNFNLNNENIVIRKIHKIALFAKWQDSNDNLS